MRRQCGQHDDVTRTPTHATRTRSRLDIWRTRCAVSRWYPLNCSNFFVQHVECSRIQQSKLDHHDKCPSFFGAVLLVLVEVSQDDVILILLKKTDQIADARSRISRANSHDSSFADVLSLMASLFSCCFFSCSSSNARRRGKREARVTGCSSASASAWFVSGRCSAVVDYVARLAAWAKEIQFVLGNAKSVAFAGCWRLVNQSLASSKLVRRCFSCDVCTHNFRQHLDTSPP